MAHGTDRCGGETGSTKMGGRGVWESKPRSVASTGGCLAGCDTLQVRSLANAEPGGYSVDGPESGRLRMNLECTG